MITLAGLGILVYAGVAGFIVIGCAVEGLAGPRDALEVLGVAVTWPVLAVGAVVGVALATVAPRLFGGRR